MLLLEFGNSFLGHFIQRQSQLRVLGFKAPAKPINAPAQPVNALHSPSTPLPIPSMLLPSF